jgi:hypothetical protein
MQVDALRLAHLRLDEAHQLDDIAWSHSLAASLGPLSVILANSESSSTSVPVHCGHIASPTANLQPHLRHTHKAIGYARAAARLADFRCTWSPATT